MADQFSLNSSITLTRLLTPRESCICVKLGVIEPAILKTLGDNKFDFAPVISEKRELLGLVRTDIAKHLVDSCKTLAEVHLINPLPNLPTSTTMIAMLKTISETGAAIVLDVNGDEFGSQEWEGLITMSDLNKHYFRILVYEWLAELEIGLVKLIGRFYCDHMVWIAKISEETQARILGYWEVSKMKSADIGPLAACTLTDLIKIAGANKDILEALSLTRSKYEDMVGGLPVLRNQVMHPVRPMVLNNPDVANIHKRLNNASALIALIKKAAD